MSVLIGSVPYLNGKPLTHWFQNTPEGRASGVEVVFEVPSLLAKMLAAGQIEAALVSSFEYFQSPDYVIAPGVSISGQDEILSVRAFSRVPWKTTETLALDTSSLTSVAMLKILLADLYGSHPAFVQCEPNFDRMLDIADGGLLIGDAGMLFDGVGLNVLDLGSAWRRLTRLPFVYAVWMGPQERMTTNLCRVLNTAKEWGRTQTETIAADEARRLGCAVALCRRYLDEIMDYDLQEEHLLALERFGALSYSHQLIPSAPGPVRIAAV